MARGPNDPAINPGGDGERIPVTEVRQGFRDRPILWVLLGGLVLVVIAFAIVWASNSDELASTEEHNARQASDAAIFDTTPQAPQQNEPGLQAHPAPDTGEPANVGAAGAGSYDGPTTNGRGLPTTTRPEGTSANPPPSTQ